MSNTISTQQGPCEKSCANVGKKADCYLSGFTSGAFTEECRDNYYKCACVAGTGISKAWNAIGDVTGKVALKAGSALKCVKQFTVATAQEMPSKYKANWDTAANAFISVGNKMKGN